MLAGSNPAARTRQFQSPRFPYRGAGRLFCTRFASSMTFRRYPIMTSGSSLPMPPRLSNCDMRFPHYQSPSCPYRFPASPHRRVLCDPPCRSPYLAWRDVIPPLSSPRSLFDGRGGLAHAPLPASLSAQSASRLHPRLASRRTARCLPYYSIPYTTGGEDVYFSGAYPFSPSI